MEGFSLDKIKTQFGEKFEAHVKIMATDFELKQQVQKTAMGYCLTKEAKFFADGIASDFFWMEAKIN